MLCSSFRRKINPLLNRNFVKTVAEGTVTVWGYIAVFRPRQRHASVRAAHYGNASIATNFSTQEDP